jgi:hypothetical protein
MRKLPPVLVAALLAVVGCAKAPPPPPPTVAPAPFKSVATVKQVMQAITIPDADVVWSVPNAAPKDDAAWLKVENSALALAESGNLLMMEGRAVDHEEWMKYASLLIDVAIKAAMAARTKDANKMADIGDELYTTCEGCHMKYMKQEAPPQK